MRKVLAICIIGAALAGVGFAQTSPAPSPSAQNQKQPPQSSSLDGTLVFANGHVAIQQNGKTYYVAIPEFMYGFVDGLKEGAKVHLEGYEFQTRGLDQATVFFVNKLVVNGKTYDLGNQGMMAGGRGFRMGPGMGGYGGPGMGGPGPRW